METTRLKSIQILLVFDDLFLKYTKIPNKRPNVPVNAQEIKYKIFMIQACCKSLDVQKLPEYDHRILATKAERVF